MHPRLTIWKNSCSYYFSRYIKINLKALFAAREICISDQNEKRCKALKLKVFLLFSINMPCSFCHPQISWTEISEHYFRSFSGCKPDMSSIYISPCYLNTVNNRKTLSCFNRKTLQKNITEKHCQKNIVRWQIVISDTRLKTDEILYNWHYKHFGNYLKINKKLLFM